MSIAVATTTITIKRPEQSVVAGEVDPWERDDPGTPTVDEALTTSDTVATNVPANIEINFGRSGGPGDTQTLEFLMVCDPTDLNFLDLVIDELTGEQYSVNWTVPIPGLPGLEHRQAGLRQVTGFGNP